jgi:hypothetical protein
VPRWATMSDAPFDVSAAKVMGHCKQGKVVIGPNGQQYVVAADGSVEIKRGRPFGTFKVSAPSLPDPALRWDGERMNAFAIDGVDTCVWIRVRDARRVRSDTPSPARTRHPAEKTQTASACGATPRVTRNRRHLLHRLYTRPNATLSRSSHHASRTEPQHWRDTSKGKSKQPLAGRGAWACGATRNDPIPS